ncbi:virion surface protein [Murmansk poxvirus]|uniref:Virion surface protein n=1 Tax=Murmansk poxvirus TaxID=2025359 RepID=A0A223FMY1_9POXV|nr:virion surface protein [Murmansk poxvirus]AST09339.1 virion surface protein [Murmansk poxvirus]
MNALSVFFIVMATAALCIIFIQLYSIYENYNNIKEFNSTHAAFEYSKSIGGTPALDRRVTDVNDTIYDVKQKWRCVPYNGNVYVSASVFGFKAIGSNNTKTIRKFNTLQQCIDFTFSNKDNVDIYNPCVAPNMNTRDCDFLKSVL